MWSYFMIFLGPSVSVYFNYVTMMRQDSNLFVCFWVSHLEQGNPLSFDCPYRSLMLEAWVIERKKYFNCYVQCKWDKFGYDWIVITDYYCCYSWWACHCLHFCKIMICCNIFVKPTVGGCNGAAAMMVNGSCRYLDKNLQNLW